MSFVIYLVAALAMPMLICCYDLASINMNINKVAKKLTENMAGQAINNDFKVKVQNCARNVYLTTDYSECLKDQGLKIKGVYGHSDPKAHCCSRVINYICMKTFLISTKCGVSKAVVYSHDNEHFKIWNQIENRKYPGHCNGGNQESITYCHSGKFKVTWSITLHLAAIVTIYLLIFGKF